MKLKHQNIDEIKKLFNVFNHDIKHEILKCLRTLKRKGKLNNQITKYHNTTPIYSSPTFLNNNNNDNHSIDGN